MQVWEDQLVFQGELSLRRGKGGGQIGGGVWKEEGGVWNEENTEQGWFIGLHDCMLYNE